MSNTNNAISNEKQQNNVIFQKGIGKKPENEEKKLLKQNVQKHISHFDHAVSVDEV